MLNELEVLMGKKKRSRWRDREMQERQLCTLRCVRLYGK